MKLALSVWVRMMKAHNLLLREARRSVEPRLTLPQFDLMAQLARRPSGMTSAELSRHLLVSAGNLTGIVARLEREKLVERAADSRDRRARRIRLTGAGRRRIASIMPRHARDMEQILSVIPRQEMRRLRDLLGRLARRLEPEGGRAPRQEVR